MSRVVILGGGTGGTLMANRLRRRTDPAEVRITVVDQDDRHVYQPGLLFVPFGLMEPGELVRPRHRQLRPGVAFLRSAVDRVALEDRAVHLADGTLLPYDVLVVASGADLRPEETEGLTGPGWGERTFTFYSVEGATALARALGDFDGGRLVVDLVDMPIKCPVAPLEFAFLADWHLTRRGIRRRTEITYVTPLDSAFTKPTCARALSGLLTRKGVRLVTEFNAGEVDGRAGTLTSYDGRTVPFDLLVSVPLHAGAPFVGRSEGLGDELDFVRVDPATLQSRARPEVFAIGDATDVPTSKAGSVAHFQGEVLTENVLRFLDGRPLEPGYDGHANCFIETGHKKALLIDFNYDVEPLPGRFPGPVGPLPLLRESRLNHAGKLAFTWMYWNVLLPGRDMPGIDARMSMAGKRPLAPAGA